MWGPEIVDKAILHAERVVDRTSRPFPFDPQSVPYPIPESDWPISFFLAATGVVNYNRKSRAIWSTHPIEKPYLIYQIGSADPELAVKAAKTAMNDVSGIDLNYGCCLQTRICYAQS